MRLSLAVLLAAALATQALPAPPHASTIVRRQSASQISPVPLAQIGSFKPYTHYASTAYCQPSSTLNWTCGPNCDANPSFKPVNSGGDGAITQFWFVGYDPALKEVIVSHQGTDTTKIFADLTDVDIPLVPLDHKLFPDVNLSVLVHMGFAATHSRSAPDVLAAVQTALSDNGAEKVTVVGHSLGAAIALLDTVFLQLQLPNTTSVRAVVYGMPRVGNQAFANYVDALPTSITHINNKQDPVPILPPILLGFRHPSGEIHIDKSGNWLACPGQDNPSSQCIVGSANLLVNNETDHDGPYDGVEMGC
ncbi:alpha/beta-hydrolase [Daedaleopsis nitida]|nr:alpha/beta-hydrolase [Daedaleopsis nitida]